MNLRLCKFLAMPTFEMSATKQMYERGAVYTERGILHYVGVPDEGSRKGEIVEDRGSAGRRAPGIAVKTYELQML
ncbi:unnamed protein product [Leptosia nina]|uniref:Uncharacterized protein n=1 Tax=Leptosia nina TaxID=320188 RepID=A0AAV1K151_9NEOP